MRVNLEVPFEQRDLARRRGARWDTGRRVWFVENVADLGPFMRWMPERLARPHDAKQTQQRGAG